MDYLKVALGECFALKWWTEYLLLFTYLITSGKDVTFPLITKFKTNRSLSYLFSNRILTSANSIILCSHHVLSD